MLAIAARSFSNSKNSTTTIINKRQSEEEQEIKTPGITWMLLLHIRAGGKRNVGSVVLDKSRKLRTNKNKGHGSQ